METTKKCGRCQTTKPIAEFYVNRGRPDGLSVYCVSCYGHYMNANRRKVREELRELLGTVCVRCGFADERALQVDHVFGDGRKERSVGGTQSRAFLNRVKEHPERYQLLCANCNQIKKYENGELGGNTRVREIPQVLGPRQLDDGRWRGVGRGGSESGKAKVRARFTPEHQAKAASAKKGRPNPKVAEARRGTKLVDGHWVRPADG